MRNIIRVLLVGLLFLMSLGTSLAQDFRSGEWILESLIMNDQSISIPNNDELSDIYLYFEDNGDTEPDGMDFQVCRNAYNFIVIVGTVDAPTSLEIGVVDPTDNGCALSENIEFDQLYFNFYNSADNGVFETEVNFENNNSTLLIRSSNGDEALYRDATLGTSSSSIDFLRIFPNPATSVLHIDGRSNDIAMVYIIDISGQEWAVQLSDGTVDISGLSSGIYFLRLIDFLGNKTFKKFIKS